MTTTTTHKITVRGFALITRTPRRYAVVMVRDQPFTDERGTYVAYARVEKRTDSLATAKRAQRSFGIDRTGNHVVVVDLLTGQEV